MWPGGCRVCPAPADSALSGIHAGFYTAAGPAASCLNSPGFELLHLTETEPERLPENQTTVRKFKLLHRGGKIYQKVPENQLILLKRRHHDGLVDMAAMFRSRDLNAPPYWFMLMVI